MAPWWGLMIGVVAILAYWPGIVSEIPGLRSGLDFQPFRSTDLRIGDFLHPYFATQPVPANTPKICVVGITSEDLKTYGAMPWPRDMHAQLIRKLDNAGADVIAFDIFFPEKSEHDQAFAQACDDTKKVILPRYAEFPERIPISRPWKTDDSDIMADASRPRRFPDGVFRKYLRKATPTLYPYARQQAHINIFYDDDVVARRVPVAVGEQNATAAYLPLGVMAGLEKLGLSPEKARIKRHSLEVDNLRMPLDDSGCIVVNYQPFDEWIDMKPRNVRALENSVEWIRSQRRSAPIEFYPYGDVLAGQVSPDTFKGAVVLVGQCVNESREDVHVTPYGSQFGVFVQSMLLYSTLTQQFLRPVGPWPTVGAILLFSLLFGTVCFHVRYHGSVYAFVAGGILVASMVLVGILCGVGILRRYGLMLEASPFLLATGLSLFSGIAAGLVSESRNAERHNHNFDLLLAAGRRHAAEWAETTDAQNYAIAGAAKMAMSTSQAIHSSEIVADTFWHTVPCEGCLLYLMEDAEGPIKIRSTVAVGFEGEVLRNQMDQLADHFAKETLDIGEPLIGSSSDSTWAHANVAPALRTFIGVPLIVRGRPLAVALLCNKRVTAQSPERRFGESDLRLVNALRYQASALLENAHRYRMEYAMFDGFAHSMAKAVDMRDHYTHGHSERVAKYSTEIARRLGLTDAEQEIVLRAATLHDVGKIGVNDQVLNKPGKLSDEEFDMIRSHAVKGYEILKSAPSFEPLLPGIRHHHERHDGRGYPDKLAGEEIPLIARIIAVADAYDAMTSNRIYRNALSLESARQEMIDCSGLQFDPKAVTAFLGYLDERERQNQGISENEGSVKKLSESNLIVMPTPAAPTSWGKVTLALEQNLSKLL